MIDSFRGKYFFLSNFYRRKILWKGHWFPTSEHAYHSEKSNSEEYKTQLMTQDEINKWNSTHDIKLKKELTTFEAKAFGSLERLAELGIVDPDWFDKSIDVMDEISMYKYTQNKDIRQMLIDTGSEILVEGNNWGDIFWGCIKSTDGTMNFKGQPIWVGQNHLGKSLMRVRSRLISEEEIYLNQSPCPKCGSYHIDYKYSRCKCHLTNEDGTLPTCWLYPVCETCGNIGYANSAGIYWNEKSLWEK